MRDPPNRANLDWSNKKDYPRADYLSSSRKRLAPQLIYKGGILNAWGRKMAVAIDSGFFATLPTLPQIPADQADVAWLVYELQPSDDQGRYKLVHSQTVYMQSMPAFHNDLPIQSEAERDFREFLQRRLDEQQDL
jgi:hypothetical protein